MLISEFVSVPPIHASPGGSHFFESHPTTHVSPIAVSDPASAYDNDTSTYARFSRNVDGYFEVGNFTVNAYYESPPPRPPTAPGHMIGYIESVDFKMRFKADAAADDRYRILYFVDPSATATVLVGWTSAASSLQTSVWDDQAEPNDATWTWRDIRNVRFRVEVDTVGDPDDKYVYGYEAWLTVSYDLSIVAVDPQAVADPDLEPGDQFSINITVDYVKELWSYQFEMSFDPEVLQGVSVDNGDFLGSAIPPPQRPQFILEFPGQGFDNVAGTLGLYGCAIKLQPPPPPLYFPTGSGTLATVTFEVVGSGVSPLILEEETALINKTNGYIVKSGLYSEGYYDTTLQKWVYHPIPECIEDGSFSNEQYALEIGSTPITGVDFTIDGELYQTPFSDALSGGSHTIEMPVEWTVDETVYSFLKWEDDSTDATRVIELDEDMALTATYIAGEFTLTIESTPISGVNFTVDGELYSTPFSEALSAGSRTIEMPTEWTVNETLYSFLKWEDQSTNATRIVGLSSDMTLTATYIKVATYMLTIDSTPISGVEFDLEFPNSTVKSYQTPFSEGLLAGSHIIMMPPFWDVDEDTYEFYAWTDLFQEPQRTISLMSNKSVTALYVVGMKRYTLEINATAVNSTALAGVSFNLDGSAKTTSFSDLLQARNHVVQMPAELEVEGARYWFVNWTDDGSVNPTRVVDLKNDTSLTAVYTNQSVHNIDKDTYYDNIQDAIDDADPDDTIEVYPRTYYEQLEIYSPLKLIGKDRYTTILDANGTSISEFVYVEAENVTISGFTTRNCSTGDGIYMEYSRGCTISENIISYADGYMGILLIESDNNIISNNILRPDGWGESGIYLEWSSNNIIYGNTVTSNEYGIDLGYYGPIFSDNNTIVANTIAHNVMGLSIDYYCNNTIIYHNNYLNNEDQAYFWDYDPYTDEPYTIWDDGYPSGGNYWSDYSGEDKKIGPNQDTPHPFPDGIGDTPYQIDADHNDTYPLMNPWPMIFDVEWDGETYPVEIISNSTITAFKFSQLAKQISFNVTGPDGTTAFCKVKIRKALLDAAPDEWTVLVNGTLVTPQVTSGAIWNQLYLVYNHSTQKIEIEGTIVVDNIPPIADATGTDPREVDEDTQPVTFEAEPASWDDIGIKNYTWTFVEDGTPKVLVGESKEYTFATPGFYLVTLEVTDLGDNPDTDTVLITVNDTTKPVADASGTNTTAREDTAFTLDGSKSSDNVGIVEYTWHVVDISENTTLFGEKPTYEGWAQPGVYLVTLNVSDAAGNWDTDELNITVLDITKPVSDASRTPKTIHEDAILMFDGSGSTDNVAITSYTWTFVDVTPPTYAPTPQTLTGVGPTYIYHTPGVYLVTLNVSDAAGNWDTDELNITVLDITRPIADAGSTQIVQEDTVVTFDGSASWDNDPFHALNYNWTFIDETPKNLTGVNPIYNFTSPGDYVVTLNVTDAAGNWDTDEVIIMVRDITYPVADAGLDQTVDEDTLVAFDGSGSTDNVGIEGYTWTFTDGGVLQTLDGVNPTYEFANPGVYTVMLRVTDAEGKWDTDTVVITVLDITPPVADAGLNQTAYEDALMAFDGSGSTDNVAITSYTWTFLENGVLKTLTGVSPSYIFVTAGVYMVNLTVADAAGHYDVDDVQIAVLLDAGLVDVTNPIADAGLNQTVYEDALMAFDGSGSTDNVGIVSYVWTFMEDDTLRTLMGVKPSYIFANPGEYKVTLNVTDAAGYGDIDTVTISVLAHSSGSPSIWDIVLVALAGTAIALGIASFIRRGSKPQAP